MSAVAEHAGVAVGTAYVHYESKDELVMAVYLEIKSELAVAAIAGLDPEAASGDQFLSMWHNVFRHLDADPARARYIQQIEASPFADEAHRRALELLGPGAEPSKAQAANTVDLPSQVVWDLGFGPAIRLAANPERVLDEAGLDTLARACLRAVKRPD
jgi:AcrR family transcriptional regulator